METGQPWDVSSKCRRPSSCGRSPRTPRNTRHHRSTPPDPSIRCDPGRRRSSHCVGGLQSDYASATVAGVVSHRRTEGCRVSCHARALRLLLSSVAVWLLCACGTDASQGGTDGGGTDDDGAVGADTHQHSDGPTGTPSCEAACEAIVGAACSGALDLEGCVDACTGNRATAADRGCGESYDSLLVCTANGPVTCSGATPIGSCDDENEAYIRCEACARPDLGSQCDRCMKRECCPEREAVHVSVDALYFLMCRDDCDDAACVEHCRTVFPSGIAEVDAMDGCEDFRCATVCP